MSEEQNIKDYLAEFILNSDKKDEAAIDTADVNKKLNKIPTTTDVADAREVIRILRGVPVGKYVDFTNTDNIRDVSKSDKANHSLIIKNDLEELAYLTKVGDELVFSSISKKRFIKRDSIISQRAIQFLKRFINQS